MAPKTKSSEKDAFYLCSQCNEEFTGTACPQCGNREDNAKLSKDGLAQSDHKKQTLFGNINNLKSVDEIMNPTVNLAEKVAQMDYEAATNNMRDTYVLKTEIYKRDLELKALQKKREYEEILKSGGSPSQPQNPYGFRNGQPVMNPGMQQDPFMGSIFPQMSPQAQLVSSLTKMAPEKRKEFLDQLSETSPEALHALSGMMQNPQQQQNPYIAPGMYPGMGMGHYGMPPWMMPPQQPQQQQQQADPLDMAVSIIQTFSELSEKNKPKVDETVKDMLREFKDEMKSMREQIVSTRSNNSGDSAILDKINSLQTQLNQSREPKTIADSVSEIKTLLDGFKTLGLIKEPVVAGETTDDKIRMKELEHKIKVEEKQQELAEKKLTVEERKAEFGKQVFMTAFQKALYKKNNPEDLDKKPNNVNPNVRTNYVTEKPSKPPTIISEVSTEAGVVRETRPTVKSMSNVVV